jgi:hypothetical protein
MKDLSHRPPLAQRGRSRQGLPRDWSAPSKGTFAGRSGFLAAEEWAVIAGVVVALVVVLMLLYLRRNDAGFRPLESFKVGWQIAPTGVPSSSQRLRNGAPEVAIYLDVSLPVGGFFPAHDPQLSFSPFRAWLNAVPPRLIELGGRGNPRVAWYSVAAGVAPLPAPPPLSRSLFGGAESRLDRAVTDMHQGFKTGRIGAAALLTDLIATGDLHGALRVGTVLGEWLQRSLRDGSDLHFGLLGVRAPYWGVAATGCPLREGLGCWLSEQTDRFHRLNGLVKIPFYAVLVGRGVDEVRQAGESLRAAAAGYGLETQFEVLSGAAEPIEEQTLCRAQAGLEPHLPQLILEQGVDGRYSCRRDEVVELICPLPSALGEPVAVTSSWPEVTNVRVRAGEVVVALDCAKAHANPPPGDLSLRIESAPATIGAVDWAPWSSATDERPSDLGKTLLLLDFIHRVRYSPPSRVAASSAILRAEPR